MSTDALAAQAPQVLATLLQIFDEQQDTEVASVVRVATPMVNFVRWDGWNDEVAVHEIILTIPPVLFARLEARLEKIEERIGVKLVRLPVNSDVATLRSARICPQLMAGPGGGSSVAPSVTDVDRIWDAGKLRVFLSHVSADKAAVARLRKSLSSLGLSPFVAHQDVEPNLEWQKEIEIALLSMDVLCALVTPDFHASNWNTALGLIAGR